MYRGQIIDGRHRYLACHELGVQPDVRDWTGDEDELLDLIVSLNRDRRHLDESSRAMAAARIANLTEGRPSKTAHQCAVSQTDAAKMMGVGQRIVQQAAKVLGRGFVPLIESVDRREVKVKPAASLADLSDAEIEAELAEPRRRPPTLRDGSPRPWGPTGSDKDLYPPRAWLEGLPLWPVVRDRDVLEHEATAWFAVQSLLKRHGVGGGRLPPFAVKFGTPSCTDWVLCPADPHEWKACLACRGLGRRGQTCCPCCGGRGFLIELEDRLSPSAQSTMASHDAGVRPAAASADQSHAPSPGADRV